MAYIESIEQLITVLQRQAARTPGARVGIIAPDETYWTIERPLTVDSDGVFLFVDRIWQSVAPAGPRFTADTAPGYTAADLAALNAAFAEVCRLGDLPTVADEDTYHGRVVVPSLLTDITKTLLAAYTAGMRGEMLVTAGCQGGADVGTDYLSTLIKQAAPGIAVVFAGVMPRLIGTVATASSADEVRPAVDAMLLDQHLSATYISIGRCQEQRFILAHG